MAADGAGWIRGPSSFLFPVRALATVFRAKYLAGLRAAFEAGQLTFAAGTVDLADRRTFTAFLGGLRAVDWIVYAKRPFGGPAQVLEYLGRYTHRGGVSGTVTTCGDSVKSGRSVTRFTASVGGGCPLTRTGISKEAAHTSVIAKGRVGIVTESATRTCA